MIITLFLALLALSIVVIWLGYYTDDEPYLPVGLFFFFLLAMVILNGQLEYQTGQQVNTTYYAYNVTNSTGPYLAQVADTAFTYVAWNDQISHWIGWSFAILSVCGFALSLFNMRRGKNEDDTP